MRIYLDASLLVALLMDDPLTVRADAFLRSTAPVLVISDFATAECTSAIARRVRTKDIEIAEARSAFSNLDAWTASSAERVETTSPDVKAADAFIRRLDLTLRAPDALNIAIAQRVHAALATFDNKMALSARILGIEVVPVEANPASL